MTYLWADPDYVSNIVYFEQGSHSITFGAIDAFNNTAFCDLTVHVIDDSPPVFENCINQTIFLEAKCANKIYKKSADCEMTWIDPIVTDNSGKPKIDTKSSLTRRNGTLIKQVTYTAMDPSNNINVCAINHTVKYKECTSLTDPPNGNIKCYNDSDSSSCLVSCDSGHAFYDSINQNVKSHIFLTCPHMQAKWNYDEMPVCALLTSPDALTDELSIIFEGENIGCSTGNDTAFQNVSSQGRDDVCI